MDKEIGLKNTDNREIDSEGPGSGAQSGGLILPDQMLPPNLFVLPMQSSIVFPTMMAPIIVSQPRFVATVEEAINRQRVLGLLLSKEGGVTDKTKAGDLYQVGVVVKILKRLKMPDGSVNLLIHSMKRFRAKKTLSERPHIVVEAEYIDEKPEKSLEMDALTRSVIGNVKQLSETNPFFSEEMKLAMVNAPSPGTVSDLVAFALSLPRIEAQEFLETFDVKERFQKLLAHLRREQNVADLQKKIQDDVNTKINTMQREFFLKEQLKVIKRELGTEEDGRSRTKRTFRERIADAGMPDEVREAAFDELEKFESISENSPEYNISRNYLELICSLPWSEESHDNLNLDRAEKILDEDHYGLEKVKERIVEFLAVRKLISEGVGENRGKQVSANKKNSLKKGSIICLVGPPGVGKTSIGRSIARTLEREFYRFSLGGMRDEAEIKGHRRTYIGAMPGKIIQAIRRTGKKNPVLLLDEIDKLGSSFQGDPASALLEVLDPEQNSSFLDHYLDVPFDLSNVLFIATANNMAGIPEPLLDRMEIIEIPGYTLEEKEVIAQKYVIPKILRENGLRPSMLKIEKTALRKLMQDYAREPGLRSLQKMMERIARKAARLAFQDSGTGKSKSKTVGRKGRSVKQITIRPADLPTWLGPKRFYNEILERIEFPGVVVGLAWTAAGGDILFIEAAEIPGSGNLKLTGQMGEVMTESANIAWSYVKKRLIKDGVITLEDLKTKDIHLHIPAGAIPKDGPSAGITMASVMMSLFEKRVARPRVAMTGELSLTGKVLPVGGIKEKILAAKRAGLKTIILPKLNEKDLIEVPAYAKKGLTLKFVSHVDEVFPLVLKP